MTNDRNVLPDFVIIGAMKAASTLVTECLRQHPDVYMPRGETPHFRDPEYLWDSIDELGRVFRGTERFARHGIKSPDYLGEPECDLRIHRDLSEPQLICVLRDPAPRAISAYFWAMKWGVLPLRPVEEGMRDILDGKYGQYSVGCRQVIDWGYFGRHLQRYLGRWPREKMLILLDQDLKRNGEAAMRQVFAFLDVRHDVSPRALSSVQNEGIYSLARLAFLDRRNRYTVTWAPDRSWAKLQRPTRPVPAALNAGVVLTDRLILSRVHGNPRPRISDELTMRLRDLYREDVLLTQRVIGRDLSAWLGRANESMPGTATS